MSAVESQEPHSNLQPATLRAPTPPTGPRVTQRGGWVQEAYSRPDLPREHRAKPDSRILPPEKGSSFHPFPADPIMSIRMYGVPVCMGREYGSSRTSSPFFHSKNSYHGYR